MKVITDYDNQKSGLLLYILLYLPLLLQIQIFTLW